MIVIPRFKMFLCFVGFASHTAVTAPGMIKKTYMQLSVLAFMFVIFSVICEC